MDPKDIDFGAEPGTAQEGDWNIVDGGMERESSEQLQQSLKDDEPVTPPPDAGSDEGVESGDGIVSPAAAAADAKPAAETPKAGKSGREKIEKRIEELKAEINSYTGQKHRTRAEAEAARREAEVAKRELEEARKELEAVRGKLKSGKVDDEPAGDKPAAKADAAQKTTGGLKRPVWKEFDEAGKDWDDFLAAQDEYLEARIEESTGKAREALQAELDRIRQDADQTAHETRISTEHRTRVAATKAAHADFGEAIDALRDVPETPFMRDVVRMHDQGGELLYQLGKNPEEALVLTSLDFTVDMFNAVMESKNPAAVLLALARDTDEFARIRSLPPAQAMFALGALDARHSSASASRERPASRGASVSSAPDPIRPVGGVSKASAGDDDDDENVPYEVWKAREDARDRKKSQAGAY